MMCDDGSAGPETPLIQWGAECSDAVKSIGIDAAASKVHGERLKKIGFLDVHEVRMKWPIGPWATGEKEKQMGQLFLKDLSDGVHGMSVKMLNGILGWPMEKVTNFTDAIRKDMWNPKIHVYMPVDIFWAQKPKLES